MLADTALMVSKRKVTISWSGGKDAAFALHQLIQSGVYEVVHLHTVLDATTQRVGMHGVHETVLRQQTEAIGFPLRVLYLEKSESNESYSQLVRDFYEQCAQEGIDAVAFGDIFLEDLRTYREALLVSSGLESIFPLWKKNTTELLSDFLSAGFKTLVCSADATFFTPEQVGQTIDTDFSSKISPLVDPCGERGEFHTFVYDGPLFQKPIEFVKGNVLKHEYEFDVLSEKGEVKRVTSSFWFQDLMPLIAL